MKWKSEHDKLLRELYPQRGGMERLRTQWPERSSAAITQRAFRIGVAVRKRARDPVDMELLRSKSKVNEETGCIEWQWVKRYGYGLIRANGTNTLAHRLAFTLSNPDVDIEELYVCHKCDNPSCINPDHLYAGTPSDNTADMMRRGRFNLASIQGTNNPHAKLSEDDVRTIKSRLREGESAFQIAKDYPVHDRIVRNIRDGKKWKHVT